MREQHERATTKSSLFRDRTSSDEILQLTYNPEFMIVFSHFRFEEVTEFQITSKMSHFKIFVKTNRIFWSVCFQEKVIVKNRSIVAQTPSNHFWEFSLKWDILWDLHTWAYSTNLIWSYRGFCINPSHLFKLSSNVPNKHFKFWIFSLQRKSPFYVPTGFCLGKKGKVIKRVIGKACHKHFWAKKVCRKACR